MLSRIFSIAIFLSIAIASSSQSLGVFDASSDIGAVLHQGKTVYDPVTQKYALTGSGSNIWFTHDELQYAWKKMKGDFILQARGSLIGRGVEPHRKFGWMIRSSLDTSSAMVCVAIHGEGLTSLQYRKQKGGNVEQKEFTLRGADVFELERKGSRYIMSVAHYGEVYVSQEIADIDLGEEVYAGLYVCAHNKDVMETAQFDNVRIIIPAKENFVPYRDYIGSNIETMEMVYGSRQIVYSSKESLQAPNWTIDKKNLIYNTSSGSMYSLSLDNKTPTLINTDSVKGNNNDHVLSFDGQMLGLSSRTAPYNSIVYTVPVKGGVPKRITLLGPSYLHSWSPDRKYLIYTAERSNNNFDIYKISVDGGAETRLTTDPALDDGPEYTPDGKYIYFNSTRSGLMQLWRMKADGSEQQQITNDGFNNWFPHISPDGYWIVFISYEKDIKPDDHPFYKHVYIRKVPVDGSSAPMVVAYLYGGQGSMNTPSWSPDSKHIAFVSNSQ